MNSKLNFFNIAIAVAICFLIGIVLQFKDKIKNLEDRVSMLPPPPAPRGGFGPSVPYFADMEVYETVTRRKLTVSEITEMIDKLPNVKTVSLSIAPQRPFVMENLAYPQYRDYYTLSRKEFEELQDYCREQI